MKMKNLERASEIYSELSALKEARKRLADDTPVVLNDVALPHTVAYRIIQVLNLEINTLEKEVEGL